MRIPLTLGQTEERSTNVNSGICVNMMPVVNTQDAKNVLTLSNTGGLKRYVRPKSGEVRGLYRYLTTLYVVVGNTLYSINLSTDTATSLGTITSTTGKVWMEYNANSQLFVTDGPRGWVYESGTLTQIADADFPGCVSAAFLDNYLFINEPDTGRVWNSNLNDFTAWTGTDYITNEGHIDNTLSILADHREAICFGEETIEIDGNSGDADAVLQRVPGGFIEIGISAAASPAKKDDVVFWLDNYLQVRMMINYSPQVISTPAITYKISQLSTKTDARGFCYSKNGHIFYVLIFPSGNLTLVYDLYESSILGKPLWHVRQSYPINNANRWRANCILEYNGTIYVGDYQNGWIYTLEDDTYTDNNEIIERIFTTQRIYTEERFTLFHEELEIEVQAGVGLDGAAQGSMPEIMMQYSDDGGHTWSNEIWREIGRIGEYKNRARWIMLGDSRDRIYRFKLTDPVNLEIVAAYLIASKGTA